jgi:hypothetical protein
MPSRTIPTSSAAKIRAQFADPRARRSADGLTACEEVEYGGVREVVASGRATCRCCGQKIAKGVPALTFAWDFDSCGSWTATTVSIHKVCN